MTVCKPFPCRLFIFDLDGTLIDSKLDIAKAVNLTLARMNLTSLEVSRILCFVGDGMRVLIERVLQEARKSKPTSRQAAEATDLFREEYAQHLLDSTRLYEGVAETLDRLDWACLGVASNKPEDFSRRILSGLGLGSRFDIVLGGDSTPQRKPDPDPLLKVMAFCNVQSSETVMVGDSPTDILAGKAAGTFTCGISWGYRSREELEGSGCDLIVDRFADLAECFCPPRR